MKKANQPATATKPRPKRPRRAPANRVPAAAEQELARETLQKFRIVFNSVKSHFRAVEEQCGVTGAQLWAIAAIAAADGIRVTELARAMSVHQSTASNLVSDLEKKGLIHKERGTDQRVVRIHLSKEGAAVAARAPKPMIGLLPEALEKLPKTALESLSANLDLLIDTMRLKDRTAAKKPLSEVFERD